MPVCPSCHLGLPWTYSTCPDCGGDLWVASEGDEDDHIEVAAAMQIEDEPEVAVEILVADDPDEPDEADEPEIAPVPRARKPERKRKTPSSRPKTKRTKPVRPPEPPARELVVVPPPAGSDREAEIDVEITFGVRLGDLDQVAGIAENSMRVIVCESAFVPEEAEPIEIASIGSAVLRKTRADLYRELTLELTGGATVTFRWLPEYNDDPTTVPVLRAALGDRLRSFELAAS